MQNPLGDDRFAAMFTNKDFQVDMESEEYKLLHPVISKHEKQRIQENHEIENEMELFDQNEYINENEDQDMSNELENTISKNKKVKKKKKVIMKAMEEEELNKSNKQNDISMGELLTTKTSEENIVNVSGSALGSRELTFKIKKKEKLRDENQEAHKKDRKLVRRSTTHLSTFKGKKAGFRRKSK